MSSSIENKHYEELATRVPEILNLLKNDIALSNMIIDMINKRS